MNSLRKILYPFSLLYGFIISIRNTCFDLGILESKSFDFPVIVVGNLNVGGTGKSPMIEYLIRSFESDFKTAVLSRGYARKTKGFLMASEGCTARDIGDEPYQFFRKFKNLTVAVDEKRVRGIEKLKQIKPELELMLLDDAFQHRYVKAGFSILLTAYDDLYVDDLLLPAGNLRESVSGARRANVVVVTKCPASLDKRKKREIIAKLSPSFNRDIFFSTVDYDDLIINDKGDKIDMGVLNEYQVLLVTGIANPTILEGFLRDRQVNFEPLKFSDHQFFGEKEHKAIENKFNMLSSGKKLILTTEKDYVRSFQNVDLPVYYIPIRTRILYEDEKFNNIIQNYVRQN
ncbi:tetraacyldisaccharide 4'-kinase [Lutimonas zeaxanthinifaciens]|uniref:tetraacyldisaccharide 4'-kinase n=1 Tax=Lutimonas zeaxanthinifaciens TaxID=3060215 RepID=UPI00265D5A81|nr:tetraacyldisaccharide 4'-kinase [Lutimonas sp. YSD2104]WKK66882.1 tetraacyldisaccharide 4'-kinase [Lutimonas sp. YSD2104]